jgi:hypothetical protein
MPTDEDLHDCIQNIEVNSFHVTQVNCLVPDSFANLCASSLI